MEIDFKTFLVFVIGIVLGLTLYSVSSIYSKSSSENVPISSSEKITEESQYNLFLHILLKGQECSPMNEQEYAQANETVKILEVFPEISGMHVAAMKYFGSPQFRKSNDHEKKSDILCIPDKIKSAVKNQIIAEKNPKGEIADPDYTRIVFMLDDGDENLLNIIENTAFYKEGISTSTGDMRPLARLVLSKYKTSSSKWEKQALMEISDRNKLGTSSAAVAASAGNEEALKKIAQLIDTMIFRSGGDAIKYHRTESLYELVVAMSLGKENAKPYVDTLIRLLNHKIEHAAPPFGIIPITPIYVCTALEKIDPSLPILRTAPCVTKGIS